MEYYFNTEAAVYRASPTGITRVVGVRDEVEGGDKIEEPFASSITAAANGGGDVVFAALMTDGKNLFLRRADGIERIMPPIITRERHAVIGFRDPQPMDDGEIVMIANLRALEDSTNGRDAIVAWRDGELRVLIDTTDPVFANARSIHGFSRLIVRGNQAVFLAEYFDDAENGAVFLYSSGDAAPRQIVTSNRLVFPGVLTDFNLIDFATPDLVLLKGEIPQEFHGYVLLRPDEDPQPLIASQGNPAPTAINAMGTIVLGRDPLVLSGPGPGEIRCPVRPRVDEIDCPADCNADGTVAVDEIVTGINIALGALQVAECPVFDRNTDEQVSVDELIQAVTVALQGCLPQGAEGHTSP
jgi:hypothetical protein